MSSDCLPHQAYAGESGTPFKQAAERVELAPLNTALVPRGVLVGAPC